MCIMSVVVAFNDDLDEVERRDWVEQRLQYIKTLVEVKQTQTSNQKSRFFAYTHPDLQRWR